MLKDRPAAMAALILVLGAALGFAGGWWFGDSNGRKAGFAVGKRYGEVQASKKAPVVVRNASVARSALESAGAFSKLPEAAAEDLDGMVEVLNRAPTPCRKYARRGVSLASSLVDPEGSGCGSEQDQVPLAWAALRSLGAEEAVAALRVERRVRPTVDGRPRRGNPDADVVLVEFSDFECPYCVRAHKKIADLIEGRDDVAMVYKHLPLRRHPAALSAAIAVEAAAEQGKFWEMHDALFALGRAVGDGVDGDDPVPAEGPVWYEAQAEAIGLEIERYRNDFRSDAVRARVDDDAAEAERLGVRGTPTFLLGGMRVRPGPDDEAFGRQIARALAETTGVFTWDLPSVPDGAEPEATPAP